MPRKQRPEGTRAPNGASSIYYSERDGKWHGRVTMGIRDDGTPDRRHRESKDEKDLIRKVRELERQRDEGNVTKPGKAWTVAQWMEHWLYNIAPTTTNENGWDAYFYATKHIVKYVGAHKLDKRFRPDHLEKMYQKMLKAGAKPGTVHQAHRTIRAALNEAVKRGDSPTNPALIAKAPRVEEDEVEPFSRDEIAKLFATALQSRNACRWIIAIALGLRQGEVLGLYWSDVDFEEGTISVRFQQPRPKWRHGCGGSCGRKHAGHCPQRVNLREKRTKPKSRAGQRPIGLPTPLVELLRQHAAEQEQERQTAGDLWLGENWLFADELGRPLNHRTDTKRWKDLLAAAGVRDARLHDARHTAATVLNELGVTDRTAMHIMGWSNSSMAKRYVHIDKTVLDNVANQVGTHLWAEPKPPMKRTARVSRRTRVDRRSRG